MPKMDVYDIEGKKVSTVELKEEIFEGEKVPEVLLSGHHKNIEKWRQYWIATCRCTGQSDCISKTKISFEANGKFENVIYANAAALMGLIPLIVLYLFLQRKIISGIEASGIVG